MATTLARASYSGTPGGVETYEPEDFLEEERSSSGASCGTLSERSLPELDEMPCDCVLGMGSDCEEEELLQKGEVEEGVGTDPPSDSKPRASMEGPTSAATATEEAQVSAAVVEAEPVNELLPPHPVELPSFARAFRPSVPPPPPEPERPPSAVDIVVTFMTKSGCEYHEAMYFLNITKGNLGEALSLYRERKLSCAPPATRLTQTKVPSSSVASCTTQGPSSGSSRSSQASSSSASSSSTAPPADVPKSQNNGPPSNVEEIIALFVALTDTDPFEARRWLDKSRGNVEQAVNYYLDFVNYPGRESRNELAIRQALERSEGCVEKANDVIEEEIHSAAMYREREHFDRAEEHLRVAFDFTTRFQRRFHCFPERARRIVPALGELYRRALHAKYSGIFIHLMEEAMEHTGKAYGNISWEYALMAAAVGKWYHYAGETQGDCLPLEQAADYYQMALQVMKELGPKGRADYSNKDTRRVASLLVKVYLVSLEFLSSKEQSFLEILQKMQHLFWDLGDQPRSDRYKARADRAQRRIERFYELEDAGFEDEAEMLSSEGDLTPRGCGPVLPELPKVEQDIEPEPSPKPKGRRKVAWLAADEPAPAGFEEAAAKQG